jgi:galactose oxidase
MNPKQLYFSFVFSFFCALLFPVLGNAQVVRTGYTSIVAANSAKCLDINGESLSAGTAAVQLHCNSSANQQWTVQNYNGSFRIIQQQTGDCLVIAGGSNAAGAALVQEPCSGVNSELWSFAASGGNFQIVSKSSGQCASVSGASTSDSASIVQETCSSASNFLWTFSSGLLTSSSINLLQAAHSGQCLDVSGGSKAVGGVVIQYPCSASANQQWTLVPAGGHYELVSQNSGLCLSDNASTVSGTDIVQSTCSSTITSDLWTLNPVGGSYEIVAENSGLCLTVPGASQTAVTDTVQSACSGVLNQLWSLSAAAIPSSWTGVTQLAVDPIAVGNLPDGNLVMWSANDQYSFEGDIGDGNGQTYTAVFNPSSLVSSEVLVTNTGDDMFCPGTANLFNGNILVNGGDSSPKTSLYNPVSGLWTSDANMNIPRGYEADTVLTNGSVMTFGGSWSGGEGGKTAEVWTQGSGWTVLSGVPETTIIGPDPQGVYRGDNHLWLFSAPNGEVFHAGPSAQMHWITTAGNGTITSAGNRDDDPYAINGNAVLYDVGLIMKTGGAPAYQDANAEGNTYLIDINGGVGGVTVTKLAPMAYPRAFANGVVLPNGQVVIIGGQTYPVPFSDATAILTPEIWDPLTRVFRQLNPMQTPRVYHSSGILLQDGRVYEGGGGQCGDGCSANHFNTEILTPPYLLNADGSAAARPVITSASAEVALGGTISANTSSPVASFVLMRLSSVTHTVNNDQRRIPLQIQSNSGNSYVLTVPSNPGIVLPGNYWLFALNAQGVPSVAANVVVSLGSCTPTPITPYLQVNGAAWQEASDVTVAAGSTVNLGPQPLGGTWSWTGPNGFTSIAREIDGIPLSPGVNNFVATYTNASSCQSTAAFAVTVSSTVTTTPVIVSLSGLYNVYGIFNNGTAPTSGGLDNAGYSYSETLIGSSVTWSGVTFPIGPSGAASAVSAATIPLPTGSYPTLKLLATGVNGDQANQTFVVTYTDGTTSTFVQSISDWGTGANYAGESIALAMTYRLTPSKTTQNGPWHLYGYSFTLNSSKIVQSITLPNNRNVVVLAIAL